jgi:hypothetical protein
MCGKSSRIKTDNGVGNHATLTLQRTHQYVIIYRVLMFCRSADSYAIPQQKKVEERDKTCLKLGRVHTLSVKACLKLLPALAVLALPVAGAAATTVPAAGAGAVAVATAASEAVLSTVGAGAVAEAPLGASAVATAGDLLPAARDDPSSGAELC